MTDKTETIKVRLTPDDKQEIKDYLEETGEFPSMSRMLRTLAKNHIRRDDDQQTASIDPEQITNAVEIALGDVTERLERIEDELAHVDSAVQSEEEVDDLAQDIAAELPVMEDGSEFVEQNTVLREATYDDMSGYDYARALSTAAAWSDYVDADVNKTRRAIVRAVEWFPDVHYYYDEEMGERRYYRTSEGP